MTTTMTTVMIITTTITPRAMGDMGTDTRTPSGSTRHTPPRT
ncbi:hypothetical protein POL68_42520 [Stigmatella sp. ncwal1]|uniref:Uncharacterized protein n=1 Tax=Stigmatella ashevillensis TaxID=2995309 RepID=A0ABT5DNG2_9BACT|nr:hypothetical protein [Stigmatella ashevillena]MDC0715200.1 hypothetical protein [Stigmatella ashevillena]